MNITRQEKLTSRDRRAKCLKKDYPKTEHPVNAGLESHNPYPAKKFAQIMLSAFYVCCIYSNTQGYCHHKTNIMNQDQTSPLVAV